MRQAMCVICALPCVFAFTFTIDAGALNAQAAQPRQPQEAPQNEPTKGSKDVKEIVSYPIATVLEATKQAVTTFGCNIKKQRADYIECTRSRHLGVFVGSGGEKVTVQLSPEGERTRVTIKTGKGFAGRLGKRNWSTPIFNEMLRLLKTV